MPVTVRALKHGAKELLAARPAQRAGGRLARARGTSLVLLHHRLGGGPAPHEVVETVAADVVRRQLLALGEIGDIVPLSEALRRSASPRPRVALTFDDEYRSHLEVAAPLLRELGVPATFFVGGRRLHGLGAYWWEVLEARIAAEGVEATARSLGIPDAASPAALAAACEGTPLAARLSAEGSALPPAHLDPAEVLALARVPGVDIGFHTVAHPLLPAVGDDDLDDAVRAGREALEAHIGRAVNLFAYPHGKAGAREAAAVRRAEYHAGFTGRFAPVHPASDPFLLPRWEPHHLDGPQFTATAVMRLHRAAPPPSAPRR